VGGEPGKSRSPLTSSHFLLLAAMLATGPAAAQTPDSSLEALVVRLAGMTAVTGYEQRMADSLLALLPGATRDRAGNVVRGAGGGEGRILMVCPLDEPGWVVGHVRPDGFLTLRRSPGRSSPQRDAQLEGARVAVHGRRGTIPGVVAVRSIHLTRGRATSDSRFTADSAYLDVGAGSANDVARLGVGVLSVVTLAKRPHRYGTDLVAAPVVGRRAACAALLDAVLAAGATRAVVAFAVEQELQERGLATLGRAAGPFAETLLIDAAGTGATADSAQSWPGLGKVTHLALPVRYAGTPVETVSLADVTHLRREIATRLEAAR
jgi:putative aminopeptidase FrvX